MIDKIIALTLERSISRQWFFLGAMTERGVSPEKIFFHRGVAASDMENSYALIAEAAAKDGFPFVKNFQGYENIGVIKQSPAQMAQLWSYAKILESIASGDEAVLVIWDDRVISLPFFFLDGLVTQLCEDEDFMMFQLRLRGEVAYMDLRVLPESEQRLKFGGLFRAFLNPDDPFEPNALTQKGFHGYDETIVFSPPGAAYMLDALRKTPDIDPDIKKLHYFDLNLPQKRVYNSCINIDNWICHYFAPRANERSKTHGIYCPLTLGFDFVEDFNLHGSLTNWVPDDKKEEYEETNQYHLQYI